MGNNKAERINIPCSACGDPVSLLPCRVRQIRKHVYCSSACSRGKQGAWKRPFEWTYNRLLKSSRQKHQVDLTYEEFLEFTKISECHYCDATIEWAPHATRQRNGCFYYLDRKDNALGYTKANCVVCCTRCNWSKSDRFTYEQWLLIGEIIRGFPR